ncbi:MAG: aspartyl protease family protein [Bacteroidetes bacterium]|nr:aspartyl protease family protein [Bacteroidota bacterium]MBS1649092.1 aspartyl protease family protein [Bacteroidota bacterium]
MKKKIVTLLLFCTTFHFLFSQEEFVLPQAKHITSFPFVLLNGGIIIIKAKIDAIPDSLNFVLDTGSGGISLDSSTTAEFKIPTKHSDRTIRGIAGLKQVDFAYQHSLKLPGLTIDNLDFHINDYELLTSVYGIKIDGIIGFSFIRKYVVYIDYDNYKIEVYNPGSIKYPRGGYLMSPQFSTLPMQNFIVKDEIPVLTKLIFDTGAGLCALFSQDFITDNALISKKRKLYPTQAEGLGGKKLMNTTVIKEVVIGPYKFKKVPVYIFSDEYNVTNYPFLGGLIGNDLLRRFNVILNYPEQKIYLKPNSHFADAFDYSYTGLGIYLINDVVTVIDIIPGSPGDKAGFKKNDIIFSIDNKISKNIQAFKTTIQNVGKKTKVVVLRNGKPISLILQTQNILK